MAHLYSTTRRIITIANYEGHIMGWNRVTRGIPLIWRMSYYQIVAKEKKTRNHGLNLVAIYIRCATFDTLKRRTSLGTGKYACTKMQV